MTQFTHNIQMAGYPINHVDEKGPLDHATFLQAFRSFPWADQAGQAQDGAEATLTVRNEGNGQVFFVSVMGEKADFVYLIGWIHPVTRKTFFGFGRPVTENETEMFIADEAKQVEAAARLFFAGEDEALTQLLAQLSNFNH